MTGNKKGKTKRITKHGTGNLHVAWNTEMWMPVRASGNSRMFMLPLTPLACCQVTMPTMTSAIEMAVWDHETIEPNERVGTVHANFHDVCQAGAKGTGPRWYNVYGPPNGVSGKNTKHMAQFPGDATHYRGRYVGFGGYGRLLSLLDRMETDLGGHLCPTVSWFRCATTWTRSYESLRRCIPRRQSAWGNCHRSKSTSFGALPFQVRLVAYRGAWIVCCVLVCCVLNNTNHARAAWVGVDTSGAEIPKKRKGVGLHETEWGLAVQIGNHRIETAKCANVDGQVQWREPLQTEVCDVIVYGIALFQW